jgi:hypothetical protein
MEGPCLPDCGVLVTGQYTGWADAAVLEAASAANLRMLTMGLAARASRSGFDDDCS